MRPDSVVGMSARLVRTWFATPMVVGLAWAFASCAAPDGGVSRAVVRDSAGIRIVENGDVAGLVAGWTIAPEPIFRMGWAEGDPQFQAVRSGLVVGGDRAVVADQGSSLVHAFSAAGEVLWVAGGPGEGPGEFGRVGTLIELPDDSILVSDGGNRRVTVLRGGQHEYDRRFENVFGEALYDPVAKMTNGSFLLVPTGFALGRSPEAGWRSYPLLGTVDFVKLDTFVVVPMLEMNASGALDPIYHTGTVAVAGGRVTTARSDRAEVVWRNPGGEVTQIVRWDETPREVTEEDWSRYESWYRERLGGRLEPERLEENLRDQRGDFAGTLPLFRFMHGAPDGNVWLGEYRLADPTASVYRVISSTGEWVGSVTFPRDIRILDITDTHVLGVETNELDVQAVVLYALDRPDA